MRVGERRWGKDNWFLASEKKDSLIYRAEHLYSSMSNRERFTPIKVVARKWLYT